jgi:hypothetical protein
MPKEKGTKAHIAALRRNIKRAQQFVRKYVKPGTSLVDELIAERRAAVREPAPKKAS